MTMAEPLISVVVPGHNAARLIERTQCSIPAHTHRESDFLVVDDGSIRESREMAARQAAEDPRIRVTRQANDGPAAARGRAALRSAMCRRPRCGGRSMTLGAAHFFLIGPQNGLGAKRGAAAGADACPIGVLDRGFP